MPELITSLLKPILILISLIQPKPATEIVTYVDKQTGCLYVTLAGSSQITPKLNKEGNQVCLQKLEQVYYVE